MSVDTADHYEVLGISSDADAKAIRSAYFSLAKIYHPDRQTERGPESTERFLAIQEAYEVLSNPRRRGLYDEQRQQARSRPAPSEEKPETPKPTKPAVSKAPRGSGKKKGPTLDEERDARFAFDKAEALMAQGSHDQALRVMKAVVRTVRDNPEYLSLAGYLEALVGKGSMHRARDLCQMAVEAQPYNAEFLARLGYVYQEVGLDSRAQHYFESALAKDPKQAIARAHHRATAKKSGGLVGAIRGLFGG